MFSNRSIRLNFLFQLLIASLVLIFLFSSILYLFISESIYDEKRDEMLQYAQNVCSYQSLVEAKMNTNDALLGLSLDLITYEDPPEGIHFFEELKEGKSILTLIYPFDMKSASYLKIEKDISGTTRLLHNIKNSIFIINIIGFIFIIVYAVALSKMLISPIKALTNRLSNMNEHLISPIKVESLPEEFEPLGETINRLIHRIENFVKYQKELFIGAAHELKTPLAVIKLKNQVTLIKKRSAEEYIEAIKVTNRSVDEMNKIVGDILNIGRQEGAQLEKPVDVDIIDVLYKKANDFKLLAQNEGKDVIIDLHPEEFHATLQANLLIQIIQNFLQNALKFTPEGKEVTIRSHQEGHKLVIEVVDEGCGVDDKIDLFAPFIRQGNKSGVGLGLFLAKSAAEALGGTISLKNRDDGKDGAIATLTLDSKLVCSISKK